MFFDKHFSNSVFEILKMINSARLENGGFWLVDFQQTRVQKNIRFWLFDIKIVEKFMKSRAQF